MPPMGLSLANFGNVSFGMSPDMRFLLEQSNRLRCAYSGKPLIPPNVAKNIYQKLVKRPNIQSAINLLQIYEDYIHDIEGVIFDIFKDSTLKTKRNFQDVLIEENPEALVRLKTKQQEILTSTDPIIDTLSEPVAELVRNIRDEQILRTEDGTFGRKSALEAIKRIKVSGADLQNIVKIYQAWYKLPKSSNNVDAFIVKYSKQPHENIAKRLISTAVATVEHVQPSNRNGEDSLSNYLLVSAQYNNERESMPLDEYIMLNDQIDIRKNLQKYMDDVINEIGRKKSGFATRSWYPETIRETILKETSGKVILNTEALNLSKSQIRENSFPERLSKKYKVTKK